MGKQGKEKSSSRENRLIKLLHSLNRKPREVEGEEHSRVSWGHISVGDLIHLHTHKVRFQLNCFNRHLPKWDSRPPVASPENLIKIQDLHSQPRPTEPKP